MTELLMVCGDYFTWSFIEQDLHCQVEIWIFSSLYMFPCRNQGGHWGGGAWLQVHTWGRVSYQSARWWSLVCYLNVDSSPPPHVHLTSTWRHSRNKCSQASVSHSPHCTAWGARDMWHPLSQNSFRLLLKPFFYRSGTVGTGEPVHFTEYGHARRTFPWLNNLVNCWMHRTSSYFLQRFDKAIQDWRHAIQDWRHAIQTRQVVRGLDYQKLMEYPHFRSFDYTQTYICKCTLDQTKCLQYR